MQNDDEEYKNLCQMAATLEQEWVLGNGNGNEDLTEEPETEHDHGNGRHGEDMVENEVETEETDQSEDRIRMRKLMIIHKKPRAPLNGNHV